MAQKEALIDALDQKDYDTIRSIVDEMRGIGTPMIWVEQAVGAVSGEYHFASNNSSYLY